jgi:hypothetical protein
MSANAEERQFVEVPFRSPLPAFCPVCGSPAEKSRRVSASEGIPLAFTYQVSVSIPYCRLHYEQVAALELRQRLALWGIFLCPMASLLPTIADWSFVWMFFVGCAFSFVCLVHTFRYSKKLRVCRGVQMRTMGSWPAYLLRGTRPEWNQALRGLVEQFRKAHETRA